PLRAGEGGILLGRERLYFQIFPRRSFRRPDDLGPRSRSAGQYWGYCHRAEPCVEGPAAPVVADCFTAGTSTPPRGYPSGTRVPDAVRNDSGVLRCSSAPARGRALLIVMVGLP